MGKILIYMGKKANYLTDMSSLVHECTLSDDGGAMFEQRQMIDAVLHRPLSTESL